MANADGMMARFVFTTSEHNTAPIRVRPVARETPVVVRVFVPTHVTVEE